MAQGGSKSRIIIWVIVGILVVVAVILLATRPKPLTGPDVDPVAFTEKMESGPQGLQKLESRLQEAGLTPEQAAPVEAKITEARNILAQMAATQDQRELRKMADQVHEAKLAARKALRAATGEGDEGDGE